MSERCVCCGDIIPEGQQVCPSCKKGERKMAELKPCPFCGGKAVFAVIHAAPGEEPRGYVRCENRCCEQSLVMNKSKAIRKWNRRAENGK